MGTDEHFHNVDPPSEQHRIARSARQSGLARSLLRKIPRCVRFHTSHSIFNPPTSLFRVPKLFLENSRGVSNALLTQLQDELEKKAQNMKGEEMIFQLAQHVQEFLHRHNKPGTKSFYEEMLNRQKEEEQKHKQAEQLERDRKVFVHTQSKTKTVTFPCLQKQMMLEEIQKRQEMLKTEMKLRKASRFDEEEDEAKMNSCGSVENSEESLCEHRCGGVIEFSNNGVREVQRGSCISKSVVLLIWSSSVVFYVFFRSCGK